MHTKPILAYHSYIGICLYFVCQYENYFFRCNYAEKDAWGGFMIITFPVKFYEMSQKNKITRAQSDVLIVDIVRAAAKHH